MYWVPTVTNLRISDTRSLPLDQFVTGTQAILAKKGSGKSYGASVQAEELLAADQQIIVIDPTGAWSGLRSSADGASPGYSIAVLGGDRGDVALESTSGELIGEAVATEHFSAILDLSLMRKGEANRFVGAFLETLYRRNRDALHVFIDEADLYANQRPLGDEARTLGATEDLVRRGRIRGLGCTMITQRPQVLAKNVLSQVDMLTCLRMSHPKDLGAVREWVDVHGDLDQAKAMIASLPSLPVGEAWLWAPATDLFERVKIRARRTFDSGRTPKAGERAVAAKVLAPVDIARLGQAIAATHEEALARDPAALRKRITELEAKLREAAPDNTGLLARICDMRSSIDGLSRQLDATIVAIGKGETGETTIHVPPPTQEQAQRTYQRTTRIVSGGGDGMGVLDLTNIGHGGGSGAAPRITWKISPQTGRQASHSPIPPDVREQAAGSERRSQGVTGRRDGPFGKVLPPGESAILRAVIQYPRGLRRDQLSVLTGYKKSSRDAYIARLRDRGLVDTSLVIVTATVAGCNALPNAEPLPTGKALQRWWLDGRLPTGEQTVLGKLIDAWPNPVRRESLDALTGFAKSTRDAYLSRLAARELVELRGRGEVRASATLFEVA